MKKLIGLVLLVGFSLTTSAMYISGDLYNSSKEIVEDAAQERTGEVNFAELVDITVVEGEVSEVIFDSQWITSVTDYSFDDGEPVFYETIYSCTDTYAYIVKTKTIKYLSGFCN